MSALGDVKSVLAGRTIAFENRRVLDVFEDRGF